MNLKVAFFNNTLVQKIIGVGESSSIIKNMALLATGSGAARIIGFASMPVITRIYSPSHMGVLSIFVAILSVIIPISTLRYSVAIPLPKRQSTAIYLMLICFCLLLISTTLLAAILLCSGSWLLGLTSMEALLPYKYLILIAYFGAGLYEILNAWATRRHAFITIAKTRVWQASAGSATKVVLGLCGLKPAGLLIGHVLSQAGGIISLSKSFFSIVRKKLPFISLKRGLLICKKYKDFPMFRLPSQFLLAFSAQAPLLFTAHLFTTETAGQLGLALTVLALPITLFGQTTGQAYYAEIAKIGSKNPHKILEITKSITKKLFFLSLIPCFVLTFFGSFLFEIIFGARWREAGVYSGILAVYLLSQFLFTPIGNALTVFNRQRLLLGLHLARAIIVILIFLFSYFMSASEIFTITTYSLSLTVVYALNCITVFKVIKSNTSSSTSF